MNYTVALNSSFDLVPEKYSTTRKFLFITNYYLLIESQAQLFLYSQEALAHGHLVTNNIHGKLMTLK